MRWVSILFHWSMFLFLCQYYIVLMAATLQYSLKSGRLIPPAPFVFVKIALAIWCPLCFHTICEVGFFFFCYTSMKNIIGSLIRVSLNLQIVLCSIVIFTILILLFRNMIFVSSVYFIFDSFHQCLTVFCIYLFFHLGRLIHRYFISFWQW